MTGPGQHAPAPMGVEIVGLSYRYGQHPVLHDIGFALERGRILGLMGPSGCGKTTVLNLVAGLLSPSAGRIAIGGQQVADAARGLLVPPERRGLGMVFQDYALWPHLTVGANVAFPLDMRAIPRDQQRQRVAAALERVGLSGFETRRPDTLSGGQQQRVAIARAIVAEPALVLFDEPLSNLDRELRESLAGEISDLIHGLGLTAIYVTHDQSEAFAIADQVGLMRQGRIVQLGSPEQIVDQPASPDIAEFLHLGVLARVDLRDQSWWLTDAGLPLIDREQAAIRDLTPTRVLLGRKALRLCDPDASRMRGIVIKSSFQGRTHHVSLRLGDQAPGIEVMVPSEQPVRTGERLGLAVDPSRLRWFAQP